MTGWGGWYWPLGGAAAGAGGGRGGDELPPAGAALRTVQLADGTSCGAAGAAVLTMPGKSSYQAMRYSGAYQLARAREELRQAELELPEACRVAGELVELNLAKGTGRASGGYGGAYAA